ncbi:MAG: Ig-like domain-containing protein [Butyrivibrio sp.]|nr:Ig-like domain-containing protein [Butyrivibrio sp.]
MDVESGKGNQKNGTSNLHFWNSNDFTGSATQTLTLDKGTYKGYVYLMGGDADENSTFSYSVTNGNASYEASGTVSGWQVWNKLELDEFEICEDDTQVTVSIDISCCGGAWGAFDDAYIYKVNDSEASDDSSVDSSGNDDSDDMSEKEELTDSEDTSGSEFISEDGSASEDVSGSGDISDSDSSSEGSNTSDTTSNEELSSSDNITENTVSDSTVSDDSSTGTIAVSSDSDLTVDSGSENTVKVTGVKLNKKKKTLKVGKTFKLKATVKPTNATNKKVNFKSSNTKVAKVNKNGKITAVGKGKATITVTTKDGKYKAKCKITVK